MSTSAIVTKVNHPEVMRLINNLPEDHWDEVPFGSFQLELDLVDEVYEYSEQSGYARFYVSMIDTTCVGYMILLASEMLHHRGVIQATTDCFYVAPEYRESSVFKELLEYVENDLRAEGIRFLTVGLNPNFPSKLDKYLSTQGYEVTEVSMTKEV
jgi:GNAT superfamily N-acetyltransferase